MRTKNRKPWSSDDLLNQLDAYASNLLDQNERPSTSTLGKNAANNKITQMSLRQKKKLRKLKKLKQASLPLPEETPSDGKHNAKSHRDQIIESLNLNLYNCSDDSNCNDTKTVSQKHIVKIEPKVFIFQDLAKKKPKNFVNKTRLLELDDNLTLTPPVKNLNFSKARYEILRFGISGFQKQKKEDANIALAIKLGAKPPPKKYSNYKEMMEVQKQEKIQAKEDNVRRKKQYLNVKKTRNVNRVSGFDGQIGKYVNGIQKISPKDIRRVATKKRTK